MDMHKQNLTMAMMDVWYAVRADINIVDAIWAAGGFSPHTPVPLKVGCILGSQDPVAVDRIACDLVGIDTDLDYFKTAKEAGMGHSDLDEIEVVGEKVSDCFTRTWVPYVGDMSKRWPEYDVRCEGACSSCQALLALSMEKLKAIGAYEACRNTHVVIGGKNDLSDITDNENLVLHGNCSFRYGAENVEQKREMVALMEQYLPAEAVIASSSTDIPTSLIAQGAQHLERIIVAHPFNPAYLIPLVEICKGEKTEQRFVDWAVAFYKAFDKTPIVLQKEKPGFVANLPEHIGHDHKSIAAFRDRMLVEMLRMHKNL